MVLIKQLSKIHLLIHSTSFVGRGGNPSLMTIELPMGEGGRSSSDKEPSGSRDGPVDSSGSTGKWNPMVPPPGVPMKAVTLDHESDIRFSRPGQLRF